MYKRLLILLLLTVSLVTSAQEFYGSVDFDFQFDNREFLKLNNDPPSQTLFGASISPCIGYRWDAHHSINGGFNLFKDFGTNATDSRITPYLYYNYVNKGITIDAGIIPRERLLGNYNSMFFSDSIRLYDVEVEGLIFHYIRGNLMIETVLDWTGKGKKEYREKFMFFGSAIYRKNSFRGGINFNAFHYAASENVRGVVDQYMFYPHVGYQLSNYLYLDKIEIEVGWFQSLQREREQINRFIAPGGALLDLKISKYRFGINNTLYIGSDLMPYYNYLDQGGNKFGNNLYIGERFYGSHNGVYDRLEFFWKPRIHSHIDLNFSFILHFSDGAVGTQQMISLKIDIDNIKFNKK